MKKRKGFIVLHSTLAGKVPAFREDDKLLFFETGTMAELAIYDCITSERNAKVKDPSIELTDINDYSITPALLINENIVEVELNGQLHSMYLEEEELTAGSKFALLHIGVRDGEREYTSVGLHILPANETADKFADEYARDFYGYDHTDKDEIPKPRDGGYYHCCSEVHVHVEKYVLVPFADYLIISKYIV